MPDLYLVDAFADQPFRGNPAAVCPLDGPRPDEWMQSVAMEMNQAETAFLLPDEADGFRLRWFTPATEVDLCGHATLASAHVLWETGRLAADRTARFHTRSGLLTAAPVPGGDIALDFPATPAVPVPAPDALLPALGASGQVFANQMAQPDYLVQLDDGAQVRALSPDFGRLRGLTARGVIVTARGDHAGIDFVSRFFAPAFGIDEDPVTGSAHCTLAPFWAERLGRPELIGFQASRRGGTVRVSLKGPRVELSGRAITVLRGTLTTG